MIKSIKIRLLPTKEQEILMFKSVGVARFAYNKGLELWNKMYEDGLKPTKVKVRTEFNQYKKQFDWISEVSAKVTAEAFEDLNKAFINYFEGNAKRPKFKSKRKSKKSFYVRYDTLSFNDGKAKLEKIGKVDYVTNYDIPNLPKYINPHCSYDGKYWYLSFGFEHNEDQVELNQDLSVGVDLGVKTLATISCMETPIKNINKTKEVRRLKKKLKRLQRKSNRKYAMNNPKGSYIKTKNIIKLEKQIKLVHRRLTNIRLNHTHQATNSIVKLYPYRVVVEDLNIRGMLKNKYLSDAIQEQTFGEFLRQMEYKCKFNGIEFVKASRWFPSSKLCSKCKTKKEDLKLSDRVFKCDCGFVCDRDKNASINLSNYKLA